MTLFEMNKIIFKNRLKKLIDSKHLTQSDLAEALNVSQPTVSSWINGDKIPTYDKVVKISNYFNVDISFLMGEDYLNFTDGLRYKNFDILETQINNEFHTNSAYNRPVVGYVQAGIPITALENIIDYEELDPKDYKNPEEYFGLKIKGDSMAPRILEGDVVIVHQQPTLESGDIGIILINGDEATCKRFILTDTGIMLLSLNPSYPPMQYSKEEVESLPIAIVGKVVELRGKF